MTFQSKQKGLTKVSIYCIGGGLIDIIAYAREVILLRLCLLEQCLDPVFWTSIKTHNFVTFYEFLIHIGVHHTIWSEQNLVWWYGFGPHHGPGQGKWCSPSKFPCYMHTDDKRTPQSQSWSHVYWGLGMRRLHPDCSSVCGKLQPLSHGNWNSFG